MNATETTNLALVRGLLAALENGVEAGALMRFFAPGAVQIELPNLLNPNGGRNDLAAMLRRAEQGRKLLLHQSYAVRSELARGNRVALEVAWEGILAVPFGSLPAGASVKAHLAMFFDLEDERITVQRNYDCFEPW